ncbi:MAG: pseudoazurin [Gammaproteobacteria bacterium]|nr:pseudoazurin [Gammaproteobacteria bacterium]
MLIYMKNIVLFLLLSFSSIAFSAEHEIKMLNFGSEGGMVFEPGFLKVNVGDKVNFVAVDISHNTESVEGLIPAGATSWKGEINENVSVVIDKEGVYVYQCTPHIILGMVGVIQAGEPVNKDAVMANVGKITIAVNSERLTNYLAQVN